MVYLGLIVYLAKQLSVPLDAAVGAVGAPEALVGLLRQAVADNPGRQKVTVRADENVAHKHVVAVMDACVQAGIEDYRIQSAPEVSADRPAGADGGVTDDR